MGDTWIPSSSGSSIPPYTISGGHDSDGDPILVGRAEHEGEVLAAKVIPSKGCAYLAWGGREHVKHQYELLAGPGYGWISCENGDIPLNAVITGYSCHEEPMYIGRALYNGSQTVGKVHSSHGCLYIPYGGKEIRLESYEVLVRGQLDNWIPANMTYPPSGSVVAGHDSDGSTIYVARAEHNGIMLPCKFIPDRQEAYVAYEGREIRKYDVEALVGYNYTWSPAYPNVIPPNAVVTGQSHNGDPLYVGRAEHMGSLTLGRILLENNCLLMPYGGREICVGSYEVLMRMA